MFLKRIPMQGSLGRRLESSLHWLRRWNQTFEATFKRWLLIQGPARGRGTLLKRSLRVIVSTNSAARARVLHNSACA